MLDARLIACRRENLFHKHGVERRSHAHRDGKDSSIAITTHAMQGLAPPLEDRHIEALNRFRVVHHEPHLLIQSQPATEVKGTLLRT